MEWRRFELGTGRLGGNAPEPTRTHAWDYFLRIAGEERAIIELLDEILANVGFDHADEIFQGLSNLRPRLVTRLLEDCQSVRAKRLFLFYADRHAHAWAKLDNEIRQQRQQMLARPDLSPGQRPCGRDVV
ncbi:type IV toxin-antitoxin system AbiEi family antitoxin domain-containing protein [Allosphingosinicella sp.]|uniref:type IV toxin-antitoxin system AbiEi family antitoxin domain-containing protein n=1 Tax=Allosphingosinicella sp. TaxID=2823234 RepID=UPI002FC18B1A